MKQVVHFTRGSITAAVILGENGCVETTAPILRWARFLTLDELRIEGHKRGYTLSQPEDVGPAYD